MITLTKDQDAFLQTIRDLFTVPDRRRAGGKPVVTRRAPGQKRGAKPPTKRKNATPAGL